MYLIAMGYHCTMSRATDILIMSKPMVWIASLGVRLRAKQMDIIWQSVEAKPIGE